MKKKSELISAVLLILSISLTMLFCTSCSTDYKKEIVGQWIDEDGGYFVFLDTGYWLSTVSGDGSYPEGTYTVDKDGVVSASGYMFNGPLTWQMEKDGSEWIMEIEGHVIKRETTDVSYWAERVSNLNQGDRLEGTTWYAANSDGGFTYLIYEKDGTFQMETPNGISYTGRYTAYYGMDAIEFLMNNASFLWTDFDEFQNADSTLYANKITFDDGDTWIDYGHLNGDVMETAIDGQDHEPVFYYKQ